MSKQAVTFVVDDEKDADVLAWLDGHTNKSATIRQAIRAAMAEGSDQEAVIREAVARELGRLPDIIAASVRDALAVYDLANVTPREPNADGEDPELAARLDAQLDEFFS